MEAFEQLYVALDNTTSTNRKVQAMSAYFAKAASSDAAWAVYFLSGRRLKSVVPSSVLRSWLVECSELPTWLVEETYESVGDLAETIALLVSEPDGHRAGAIREVSLTNWVNERIEGLRNTDVYTQNQRVKHWWKSLPYGQCYVVNKLLTGGLRVGVSQALLARSIAQHASLDRAVVLHRLMGDWSPNADFWEQLIAKDEGETLSSRPYPFCLASPLTEPPEALGDVNEWLAEWKWDGVRAQVIRRDGQTYIWSRGEELITERFPEVASAASQLPDGTVLDGEILAWDANGVLPFSALQRRIGRKKVGKKLLTEVPCCLLVYDQMEQGNTDIRQQPMNHRRAVLESTLKRWAQESSDSVAAALPGLRISVQHKVSSWDELHAIRAESRVERVEGLMLKHYSALYETGRKRGLWWKWKVEPYTVDAVLLYAQAGHGRRSNLYTDYTFGVWNDDELVPVAKAYSGLNNDEINTLDKWIRKNTLEKFGPVRAVEKHHVFELAFEGINASTRHKSGIAVRFPRIVRWRHDKSVRDADSLDDVRKLMDPA